MSIDFLLGMFAGALAGMGIGAEIANRVWRKDADKLARAITDESVRYGRSMYELGRSHGGST